MKNLTNAQDREELLRRMGAITVDSPRVWGRMKVGEMVCHMTDAFAIAMGERNTKPIGNWTSRNVIKPLALWYPRKWPQGFPTVPECDARRKGTPPAELQADLVLLHEAFGRFTQRPRAYALQAHPIFGKMNEKEWMRWGYLHTDHHLRQFGA